MKLKEVREKLGLTQREFADYFDIQFRSLQNWEIERSSPPHGIEKRIERIVYLENRLGIKKEDYDADIGGDDNE